MAGAPWLKAAAAQAQATASVLLHIYRKAVKAFTALPALAAGGGVLFAPKSQGHAPALSLCGFRTGRQCTVPEIAAKIKSVS
jgi:hypothetical protein